jgi:ABC-type bacteriocin/lantibiotic exporter with double-glycine peptidase domain
MKPPGAQALRYLLGHMRGKEGLVALVAAMGCIQSLAALPMLYGMRHAFNQVIPAGRIDWLVTLGLSLAALRIGFGGLALLGRWLTVRLTKGIVREIRSDLLAYIYALPANHFAHADAARLQTRIVTETERLDVLLSSIVSTVLPAALAAVTVGLVLVYLNIWLVLLLAVLAPCVWGGTVLASRRVRRAVRLFQSDYERFSQGVHFILRHLDLTRMRGFENGELARQTGHVQALERSGIAMAMSYAVHGQVQSNLVGLGGCVLLIGGGAAVIGHVMTLGDLIAFYLAAGLLNGYASTVTAAIPDVIAGEQSLNKLADLRADAPSYSGTAPMPAQGDLILSGVTFGFGPDALLDGASMVFRPGEVVALFGRNGAGKSTLVSLILGFHRPWRGALSIGPVPYSRIDIRALRRSFGVVPQHPTFFPGTIAENVGYGRPEASVDDVREALELAGAAPFVDALPERMQAPVGEGGALISGGEAQKLAIARALVGRPDFLILDEPTNHLDVDAIAGILRRLSSLPGRPAVLIISHDPQVATVCDRVLYLQDGHLQDGPRQDGPLQDRCLIARSDAGNEILLKENADA